MTTVFLHLLEVSVTAGLVVIAVCLLRLLFKRAPKWIAVLLWGLVAVRLLLPVSIESPVSIVPDVPSVSTVVGDYTGSPSAAPIVEGDTVTPEYEQTPQAIVHDKALPAGDTERSPLLSVVTAVWIVGVAAMLLYMILSYHLMRRRVRTATRLHGNVYQCETVASPFILGIFSPKIYLPYTLPDSHVVSALAHERAHIRRGDHLIKPLGFLLLAVYWFQPLLWVAYVLLCRDIEAACDERVVKDMTDEERRHYSSALVTSAVGHRRIAACPLAFGETAVKARVKNVLNYRRPAFWVVLTALVLSCVAAVCLLTDPVVGTPTISFDDATLDVKISDWTYERIALDGSTPGNSARTLRGEVFYFDIEECDPEELTVTVKVNEELTVNGKTSHTVVIPYNETVRAAFIGADGANHIMELSICMGTDSTGTLKTNTVKRFSNGEITLFLYSDRFRLTMYDQPIYTPYESHAKHYLRSGDGLYNVAETYRFHDDEVMGGYEWLDNDTLVLTEYGGVTQYTFDIADDGETLIHRRRAMLRHKKAMSPILRNRLTLSCEYTCEWTEGEDHADITVTSGDGDNVASFESLRGEWDLESIGGGNVVVTTETRNGSYTTLLSRVLDTQNAEWGVTCVEMVSDTSHYAWSLTEKEDGRYANLTEQSFCGMEPLDHIEIRLDDAADIEGMQLRAVKDGSDWVVQYTDSNGKARVKVGKGDESLNRYLFVTTGEPIFDYVGLDPTKGETEMHITADGVHVWYDGISAAFVKEDGDYTELIEALESDRLTVAQFEERVREDVQAGTATVLSEESGKSYAVKYNEADMSHTVTFEYDGNSCRKVTIG